MRSCPVGRTLRTLRDELSRANQVRKERQWRPTPGTRMTDMTEEAINLASCQLSLHPRCLPCRDHRTVAGMIARRRAGGSQPVSAQTRTQLRRWGISRGGYLRVGSGMEP